MLGRFRVGRPGRIQPAVPLEKPQTAVFRAFEDPTSSPPPVGSFEYDLACGKYQHKWDSFKDFEGWFAEEQRTLAIELRLVNTYQNAPTYERALRYVCSRGNTGGRKDYTKLHPQWNRKHENKYTDCKCTLIVKQYAGNSVVLGNYSSAHNHDIGNLNLRFTQIPKDTREYIAGMLRLKVSPEHIVCFFLVPVPRLKV
jgi:hypothetical protein